MATKKTAKRKYTKRAVKVEKVEKPLTASERKQMLGDRADELLLIISNGFSDTAESQHPTYNIRKELMAELSAFYDADKGLE